MRIVAIIAMLVGGCGAEEEPYDSCGNGSPDIGEECDPGADDHCSSACYLESFETTAHWSFETLSGDVKAPCLPGEPQVTLEFWDIFLRMNEVNAPCASGSWTVRLKYGSQLYSVSSFAGHEYVGSGPDARVTGPGDLPTAVIYTDAGSLAFEWQIWDAQGAPSTCASTEIEGFRIFMDGVLVNEVGCSTNPYGAGTGALHPEGTHTVRVEAFHRYLGVIATWGDVDVTVVAGTVVRSNVELRL